MLIRQLLLALLIALAFGGCNRSESGSAHAVAAEINSAAISNAAVEQAYAHRLSNVQVMGTGSVIKLLADDTKGSRHQKFLVRINPEQTLLFAHNIDLAPRVPVKTGDEVSFYGEYVYNPKGGIIHWTHRAPQEDHEAGWIMLNGQKYQ